MHSCIRTFQCLQDMQPPNLRRLRPWILKDRSLPAAPEQLGIYDIFMLWHPDSCLLWFAITTALLFCVTNVTYPSGQSTMTESKPSQLMRPCDSFWFDVYKGMISPWLNMKERRISGIGPDCPFPIVFSHSFPSHKPLVLFILGNLGHDPFQVSWKLGCRLQSHSM